MIIFKAGICCAALFLLGSTAWADDPAPPPVAFHIEARSLKSALTQFGEQSGLQILFSKETVEGLSAQGVTGTFTPEAALQQIIAHTGLKYEFINSHTVRIWNNSSSNNESISHGGNLKSAAVPAAVDTTNRSEVTETPEKFAIPRQDNQKEGLSEIIVTAQKREERLQDVPAAITVLNAASLIEQQQLTLQDYYATVPGLSINDYGNGRISITMRGLSTGDSGNPTVGMTIDDVPIGATDTALINGATFVPELDPADLQRIEFLKGPQGTLYGAASLGGAVRYVTVVPDLQSLTGNVQADGSVIPSGAGGYAVRSSVNIPVITDAVAIRVSGFDRRDPGYIDDPTYGERKVNSTEVSGGYLSVLVQPAQNVTLRLSALIQRKELNGDGTIDTNYLFQPATQNLNQTRLPGTGMSDYEFQLYSANLNFHFDSFDITSVTGYSANRDHEDFDESPVFGGLSNFLFPGVQGATEVNTWHSGKFTQEVRLSSPTTSIVAWQIGGFYTDENNYVNRQQIIANDLATGAPIAGGVMIDAQFPTTYKEYAAFGNLTYHFTDKFNVQVGARESHNQQSTSNTFTGVLYNPPFLTSVGSKDSDFTYLIAPQFRVSDAITAYARIAAGYEPGGPNAPPGPGVVVDPTFAPSRTTNYELGVKSRLLERRLSIDADIFYIDWSKIQLLGVTPVSGVSYFFNGGKAKSEGLELAVAYQPIEDFTISATSAYTDAKLTNTTGNGFPGVSGDPLPFSSKYTGSVSAEQRFTLTQSAKGFVGATAAYVGKRYEAYSANVGEPQAVIPGYGYGNVRAGFISNGFTVTAFAKNITNERGVLNSTQVSGVTINSGLWHTAIITPRTIGLSVSKSF